MLERFQPYVLDHFGDHVTVSVCVEHYTVLYCAVALRLLDLARSAGRPPAIPINARRPAAASALG